MDPLKKTLITGGNGMVGSYFDFGTKLDRRALDVTDLDEVNKVFALHQPRVVVHLAAETDVDRCEHDPSYGYYVNSIGTWNVAMAAKKIGAKMIYVSTVYVFDGTKDGPYVETDEPSAPNYYGRSKHLGEVAVQGVLDDYLILRAGWMFGGGPAKDQKFVAKIIKQLGQPEIKAIQDNVGSLTYAKDLARKIKDLILAGTTGKVIHTFNEGLCSRYDVAVEIVKIAGRNTQVIPVDSSYFNLAASRSHSDKMASLNGGTLRPWREALADYLTTEWTGSVK